MNILVLNAGSGSHKCSLFRVENALPVEPLEPIWKAVIMATDPGSTAQELSLTIECEGRKKGTEDSSVRSLVKETGRVPVETSSGR
jgi:acetate kinase